MAKRIVTTTEYTDDLTGGKAEGTISFALEGKNYEIDLSRRNIAALRKAMKPFIDAARPARSRSASRRATARRSDLDEIRAWAKKHGHKVADRGRIAASVIEAYDAR